MVEVLIIRLHGRRFVRALVRPVGVVEALEFSQLDVQGADAQLAVAGLVELVSAGGVGALDAAAMLGAFGRQHEQGDAAALAGGLELDHGLAAAVNLHRLDFERHLAHPLELGGRPVSILKLMRPCPKVNAIDRVTVPVFEWPK